MAVRHATQWVLENGRNALVEKHDAHFRCTYELLSFMPSLADPNKTVRDEMREFNEKVMTHSHSRLVRAMSQDFRSSTAWATAWASLRSWTY